MRQRCFAQAWRAEQQHVVKRLIAGAGSGNENIKLITDFLLPVSVYGSAKLVDGPLVAGLDKNRSFFTACTSDAEPIVSSG